MPQIKCQDEDLALIHECVVKACLAGISEFLNEHKNTFVDYDFNEGELVLVLKKKIEKALGRKGKHEGPVCRAGNDHMSIGLMSHAFYFE